MLLIPFVRLVIATMPIEEINTDRDKLIFLSSPLIHHFFRIFRFRCESEGQSDDFTIDRKSATRTREVYYSFGTP
jgi:hypothetical protein